MSRCFIGLPVPKNLSKNLTQAICHLAPNVRLVPEANHHITLAFLGDQSADKINSLADQLRKIRFASFRITLVKIAPFPQSDSRILAAWVDPSKALWQLQKLVITTLEQTGIDLPDKKQFLPHITLGRRKPAENPFMLNLNSEFDADSLNLYRSEPGIEARQYSIINSVPCSLN